MLETALTLGRLVATHAAKAWLGDRRKKVERTASLTDLTLPGAADGFARRKLSRQLEDIGDHVAQRLEPMLAREFSDLPDGERQAALDAVVDVVEEADLTDALMLESDMDAAVLARRVRTPGAVRRAGLGEQGTALFDLVLLETCGCLLAVVQQLGAFQARATVELLARLTTAQDDIARVLDRLPRATLLAPDGDTHDAQFTSKYLHQVSAVFDELEIFGIDVRRYRPRTSVTVAYLSLTATTEGGPAPSMGTAWSGAESAPADGSRVEDALAGSERTLLRGQAGSGKTTLLQWVMVTAARSRFTGALTEWNGKVPFLVRLRAHAEGDLPGPEDLVGAVAAPLAGMEPRGWALRRFTDGTALLLVDGVDELRADRRARVRRWLSELLTAFPNTHVVVTSRPAAAQPRWLRDLGFASLLLDPMSGPDITEFSARWHASVREWGRHTGGLPCTPAELDDYEASLLRHLDGNRHLRTLATSPLLAAMLCALNLDRRKQLPPDRMRLYSAALDLLLERRDTEREIPAEPVLSGAAKIAVLQQLAWWLTLCARSEASTGEAEHQVALALRRMPDAPTRDAPAVLRHLLERSGVIREPVVGRVDFIHRTFQEYLAGKQAADEHCGDILVRNAHSDQWRETIIMGVGHASVPVRREILEKVLARADAASPRVARKLRLVATACLETASTLPRATTDRMEVAMQRLFPPRAAPEARSLSQLGERAVRHLPSTIEDLSPAVAKACLRTAVLAGGPASLRLLARYAQDPRREVQLELAALWKFAPSKAYAEEVLADAPLVDGVITVERPWHVRHTPLLRHLRGAHVWIRQRVDHLGFLHGGRRLVSVYVSSPETRFDLTHLRGFDTLHTVRLSGAGARTEGLDVLATLPALTSLWVVDPYGAATLDFATGLRGLRNLSVLNSPFDDHAEVMRMPNLTRFGLSMGNRRPVLGNEPSATIGELDLTKVDFPFRDAHHLFPALGSMFLTDRPWHGFDELTSPTLRKMVLTRVSDVDLSAMARLPRLEEIYLNNPKGLDLGLGHLRHCENLRHLAINDTARTVDLAPLREVRSPLRVQLYRTPNVTGRDELPPHVTVRRWTR